MPWLRGVWQALYTLWGPRRGRFHLVPTSASGERIFMGEGNKTQRGLPMSQGSIRLRPTAAGPSHLRLTGLHVALLH